MWPSSLFDFGEGKLAQVYVSWYALEKVRKINVVGSMPSLPMMTWLYQKLTKYARRYEQGEQRDPLGRPRWHWRDDGGEQVDLPKVEPLKAECQHFIECVATGTQPRTDGKAGLESVTNPGGMPAFPRKSE